MQRRLMLSLSAAAVAACIHAQDPAYLFTGWSMARLRSCGAIVTDGVGTRNAGWFVNWMRQDGRTETMLVDTLLKPLWDAPYVSAPRQSVTEVVTRGHGHVLVLAEGAQRIRVLVDGSGRELARHKARSTGQDRPEVTAHDLFNLRKTPGTIMAHGTHGYLALGRTGVEGYHMELVALDSTLKPLWAHEMRAGATTTALIHVLDVTPDRVLVLDVLVRNGAYGGYEPCPPLQGPYQIVACTLVWLDASSGREIYRRELTVDGLHFRASAAWPGPEGRGLVMTGSVFGNAPGPTGAFRAVLDSADAPLRPVVLSFRDPAFDSTLAMNRRLSDLFKPMLVSALRRTDGSIVQAGEQYAIGTGTLTNDVVTLLGIISGIPSAGAPADVREYARDMVLVEWPADGSPATVRKVPRPVRAGVHDRLDGTINFWGAYPAAGGDVYLLHGDPEHRTLTVVRAHADGIHKEVLAGVPDNIQWIALPPQGDRLPLLCGPPGGAMYLKLVMLP